MREESQAVVVRLPADLVWDHLSDYDKVVRLGWADASARRLDDPGTCETRFKAHTSWEGIRTTYTVCLEQAERPHTLLWSTRSGGSRSWLRFDMKPMTPDSTQVTVTLNLKHGAALRALEPFAWGIMRPAFVQTLAKLEHLDTEIGKPSE